MTAPVGLRIGWEFLTPIARHALLFVDLGGLSAELKKSAAAQQSIHNTAWHRRVSYKNHVSGTGWRPGHAFTIVQRDLNLPHLAMRCPTTTIRLRTPCGPRMGLNDILRGAWRPVRVSFHRRRNYLIAAAHASQSFGPKPCLG